MNWKQIICLLIFYIVYILMWTKEVIFNFENSKRCHQDMWIFTGGMIIGEILVFILWYLGL